MLFNIGLAYVKLPLCLLIALITHQLSAYMLKTRHGANASRGVPVCGPTFLQHQVIHECEHSFIHSSGVAAGRWQSFDVPFSLPPALRPRHGPVRNSLLTLGLVLYVYRA